MNDTRETRDLYDRSAPAWVRNEPESLSDFTARPAVLDLCRPLAGRRVLDLGCGEGYVSRQICRSGARSVIGVDLSLQMIAAARREEERAPLGIRYEQGDATLLSKFPGESFELVVAVFLFNYLGRTAMQACMKEVARVLCKGGQFVFAVPHPAFPYLRRGGAPFYFDIGGVGYFAARDTRFGGKIWKRDGTPLDVQIVHKTFEDYFVALGAAGFQSLPLVRELHVTGEVLAIDPDFFRPLLELPLHLVFSLTR
jgi:SAM-dependent methyltransferase